MKTMTIIVDSRERYPLPFPASIDIGTKHQPLRIFIKTTRAALSSGDYCLELSPDTCIVERKASRNELASNFFDPTDKVRAMKAFRRLASATACPVLLMEVSPHELFLPQSKTGKKTPRAPLADVTGDELLFRITTLAAHLNLHLLWFSRAANRTLIGTVVAHYLLSKALKENPQFLEKLLDPQPPKAI